MTDSLNPSFSIALFCLWGAPPMAITAFFTVRRHWPGAVTRISIACALLIATVVVCCWFGVSLVSTTANAICLAATYVAYCFLAISAWRLRQLILRVLTLLVAALPIAVGYVLASVGMLGLMFIVGDYTRPPLQNTEMTTDLECRVTSWGMAASDTGYTVHLYQHWRALPFLEREVAHIVINETNPLPGLANASCDDALKAAR